MGIDRDPRTSAYNQQGDVWRHSYAFHPESLRTVERSPNADDEADALYYYARINEAADRKLAQALRAGAARIRALEAIVFRSKVPTEGNTE
jgi:transcription elongation GreA/GreB family factor